MKALGTLLDDMLFNSSSPTDQDRRFEELVKEFLCTDAQWSSEFKTIWSWQDWPAKKEETSAVDLVGRGEAPDSLVAVRCVFHDPGEPLTKAEIEPFLAASLEASFTGRLVVTTTDDWDSAAEAVFDGPEHDVRRVGLSDLLGSSIDWAEFAAAAPAGAH
ncbi:hypothetical protein [Promicromonospora sp. NPDC057488]|uniref:restriction endonuclease n=1 Tax=Promicromonospora sp. NPDC057488 TaxID=3346147 RepID=UPI00367334A0